MRQSFKLKQYIGGNYHSQFYETKGLPKFAVCTEFVRFCGVTSPDITVTVSSKRPGKKGWKIVRMFTYPPGNDPEQCFNIGKEKKYFESLYYHRKLFSENNTNVGWIKVDSK
jgi:hypothetical protein